MKLSCLQDSLWLLDSLRWAHFEEWVFQVTEPKNTSQEQLAAPGAHSWSQGARLLFWFSLCFTSESSYLHQQVPILLTLTKLICLPSNTLFKENFNSRTLSGDYSILKRYNLMGAQVIFFFPYVYIRSYFQEVKLGKGHGNQHSWLYTVP